MEFLDTETIDRAVFDGETLPIEEEGPEGENPWRLVDQRLEGNATHDRILVTDSGDSDGLGCAALLTHKFDGDITVLPASHRNWGYDPVQVLKNIRFNVDDSSVPIYITDLGQSEDTTAEWFDAIWQLADKGHQVYVRDHHENPQQFVDTVNAMENAEYIHDESICATMNVLQNDYPDAPDHIQELAEYTNVRDLFLSDDPRFMDTEVLSNAAFWFPFDHYVNVAAEHGINLMNDPEWGNYVEKRTHIKSKKLDRVMETREFHTHAGAEWGFVHGECYHSEAGRRLLEEHGADIAVIVKPSGKLSFRTSDEYPVANDIAAELGGGGHGCAAGAGDHFNDIDLWADDPLTEVRETVFEVGSQKLA